MIDRRKFLAVAAGAGAGLAISPQLLRALKRQQSGKLIERAIPSTGEMLPAVGLSFSNHVLCADRAALREVLKTFADDGGRVFDAMHGNETAEQFHATVANELGIQNKIFWSTRGTPPGGGTVNAHIDTWLAWTQRQRMDLVMVPAQGEATWLAALKQEKKAGRVRYIGVQVIGDNVYPQLEGIMRNEPIDFIGVDYDIGNRARVEDTILPLALKRKIGVMAFFPFGNNGGISCGSGSNLFGRVANRPLPEWAGDFDARTWAQFFLKYVISHPAITVARVGTTKPAHMLDNMAGGVGRLPDETTRKRMAELVDSLPPASLPSAPPTQVIQGPAGAIVLPATLLDRYVGKYKTSGGETLAFRRYGNLLTAKPGSISETVIYAHSETRFSFGANWIEFQRDSAGSVTGLVLQQGREKIHASRIR